MREFTVCLLALIVSDYQFAKIPAVTDSAMLAAAVSRRPAFNYKALLLQFGGIEEHKSGFTGQLLEVLSSLPLLAAAAPSRWTCEPVPVSAGAVSSAG